MPIVVKHRTVVHEGTPEEREYDAFWWWCAGCAAERVRTLNGKEVGGVGLHVFDDRWTFNGDFEKPTFRASYLTAGNWTFGPEDAPEKRETLCHSFVTDGMVQYLDDTTHELRGQTVPMAEIPPDWID